MLKPENSRLLAKVKQYALRNKDYKMIQKVESIKKDDEITFEIRNYKLKDKE